MKKVFRNYCLLLVLIAFMVHNTQAQTNVDHPIKYNKEFSGIGPKVYILPPPKTEQELLQDQYSEKKKDQEQLLHLMGQLELSTRLKRTDNGNLPLMSVDSVNKEAQIIAAINHYKQLNKRDSVLAWQNHLGTLKLLNGQTDEARKIFKEVLENYTYLDNLYNQQAVLYNLAILEEYTGNYVASLTYYDALILQAKKTKNIQSEGLLNLSIATIESKLGNYSAAHNLVIKKSFPMLQKGKNFVDVVNALNTLARIKESEEKLIEAKWIYLQAIDVATIHKDEKGLAQSLFNLAELKVRIGDGSLAIEDYKMAKKIAQEHNMTVLMVEIEDGLGDVYLNIGNYTEAALALNSYNILKGEFISNPFLM